MKIAALQSFVSHEDIEEEGVWCPIAADVEFKIRRMRSKTVERAKERIYGPTEKAMRGKDIPDALEVEFTKRLMSQAIVVDWRGAGMVDDAGNAIPFTADNCYAVLSDEATSKDLRGLIIQFAMDGNIFVPESDENKAAAGN